MAGELGLTVPAGARTSLTCVASGSPPISYRWFRSTPGGKALLLSSRAELAWDSLQPSDAGEYYCEAENRVGAGAVRRSDAVELTVGGESPARSSSSPLRRTEAGRVPCHGRVRGMTLSTSCLSTATRRGNSRGWHRPCFGECPITAWVRKMGGIPSPCPLPHSTRAVPARHALAVGLGGQAVGQGAALVQGDMVGGMARHSPRLRPHSHRYPHVGKR